VWWPGGGLRCPEVRRAPPGRAQEYMWREIGVQFVCAAALSREE
jgi:hypothetical protein